MADHTSPPTPLTPTQLQALADADRGYALADVYYAGELAEMLEIVATQLLTTQQRLAEVEDVLDQVWDKATDFDLLNREAYNRLAARVRKALGHA